MAFELKQNLKLSQQLIMTPQLQQAIKLLQLSRIEMSDVIQQEIEENPLLEEAGQEEEQDELTPEAPEFAEIKPLPRTEEITGEGDGKDEFDWDSYLEDYGPVGVTYYHEDMEGPTWENVLTKTASLADHLLWQLSLSRMTPDERRVGEQIIGNLDADGYLKASIDEISELESVQPFFVLSTLKKVQEFDPPGIAARDLQECLLIQSRYLVDSSPLLEKVIREHLKDLETKNFSFIAKKLKVSIESVMAAFVIIGHMDPKPGRIYGDEKEQYIIPDVFVIKVGDEYRIVINEDGLPKLRISNFYREIMGGTNGTPKSDKCKDYVKERLQSATWLIKSIQQRQKTIFRVSESIVRFQREFFDKGIGFLKPMVLRDVAEDVQMHESTISRVTTNKYMHTPRGVFELKYFFNSSIHKSDGDFVASKSVQESIKKIIQTENKKRPYSDSEIVNILKAQGVSIARRTVAKYRDIMGILPSSKRKKYFDDPKRN